MVAAKLCHRGGFALCILKRLRPPALSFSLLGRLGDGIDGGLSPVPIFSFALPELRPPPGLCDHSITLPLQRPGFTFEMLNLSLVITDRGKCH